MLVVFGQMNQKREDINKTERITFYNLTKSAVNSVDKKRHNIWFSEILGVGQ